jgi:hypothetical protein
LPPTFIDNLLAVYKLKLLKKMTAIVKPTVEPTKNELSITEVPTVLTSNRFTTDGENESEIDDFTDIYGNQVDVEEDNPYNYNGYTLDYESDYKELSKKEIDSFPPQKVDSANTLISNNEVSNVDEKFEEASSIVELRPENIIISSKKNATTSNQDHNSISNASSSDDVSNDYEKTDLIFSSNTAQSRRENTSRTSSTDSFQTDISEKENRNVSDHESDTSYEKDDLEKDEELTSKNSSDNSKNNSGENKLGKSLDKSVNNLVKKISEEFEDKSGEIEKKSDKLNKKLAENSPSEIISETIVSNKKSSEELENKKLENINSNTISNTNQESVANDSLTVNNVPLHNDNGKNLQNIPNHGMGILPIDTSFSSFSSEDKDSMTESFNSKSSGFSSNSMHQKENQDFENIVEDKNALNRMSVASLRENPELNDISLDDDSLNIHESPKEWNFSDWGFPKTPTSLKTFFSPRSTTSTVTSTSSKSSSSSEKNDPHRISAVSMTSTGSNYDLLLARLEKENQMLQGDPKAKRMSLQGIAELKASFERVQHEAQIDDDIDWGKL